MHTNLCLHVLHGFMNKNFASKGFLIIKIRQCKSKLLRHLQCPASLHLNLNHPQLISITAQGLGLCFIQFLIELAQIETDNKMITNCQLFKNFIGFFQQFFDMVFNNKYLQKSEKSNDSFLTKQ